MAMIGGLVCGRFGTTRAGRDWFGEDIREGEGRLFGFTLEGYPEVITLALITVTWKITFIPRGQIVIKRICREKFCIVFFISILNGRLP